MQIEIIREPLTPQGLQPYLAHFANMMRVVVDVERGVLALGGETHADEEQALVKHGSLKEHLWGANVYPGKKGEDKIVYVSLVKDHPGMHKISVKVQDPFVAQKVRNIVGHLIPSL